MELDDFERILRRFSSNGKPIPIMAPCGHRYLVAKRESGVVYCDGKWHHDQDGAQGECPTVRQARVQARLAGELRRLSFESEKLSSPGFESFDPTRAQGGAQALAAMKRFALKQGGPHFSVLLHGKAGLGKTHLLLASHFTLLGRGVVSEYVRTPELRRLFRRSESFDSEVAEEARGQLDRYVYAQAVHFDDAGHVENDQRARGAFAEGLKDLLDRTRSRWATATNRSAHEAEQHPDLTGAVVSRLLHDCEIIRLAGPDQRPLSTGERCRLREPP